ncbi:MAG: hypothetical protein RIQ60_1518 [Pseudomonadota bacterium]|jgi:chemotaxis protein CheZ
MTATALPADSRQQLGAIVRQLHDALHTLGYTTALQEVAQEIPDARERLAHVGEMTERAAHKVLTLVDEAKPGCSELERDGQALLSRAAAQGGDSDSDGEAWHQFARQAVSQAQAQQEALSSIMMAQDFQDLSGQVIQKVIAIITRTERQLVDLLTHDNPDGALEARPAALLSGPEVPSKAMAQDDVDDLLASMGF